MPYPVAKLLKEKISDSYKLTTDGSQFLNQILVKLEDKLSKSTKNSYLDSASNFLGSELASYFDVDAKTNAYDASSYKSSAEATKQLGLVFPVHRTRGGDLQGGVYCTTFLQNVAFRLLNESRTYSVNDKIGKAQIIIGFSYEKANTIESTMNNMSAISRLMWKLGYAAPQPTDKQLKNPKYTDYGMQCILSSKGFQAVKMKINKDGDRVGDPGLSYKECMTVLNFNEGKSGCSKQYQTRNLLTGRCEGKKPCASYQTRDDKGRCKGKNPAKRSRVSRKSRKSCKYGVKKSGDCKKKPGAKRKTSRK